MWSNFHTHCHYCDGKGPVRDYVQAAAAQGLLSLGMSSHAPLPFPSAWCMKPDRLDNYLQEINSLKLTAPLPVYAGLEVDYIPGIISPSRFASQLDYTIGSVHFTEQFADGTRWEVDGTHVHFLEGLDQIFHNNIRDAVVRYFEITREMVKQDCPTIIAHLDKIKIQNIDHKFFNEQDPWYQQEVKRTLDIIAGSGAIVEVNTRGIYQKKSATTYPSPWALSYMHQKKIPVTLSSDAHHPDDLINQFAEAARLLSSIGFKTLSILHEGRWQACAFTEHGIIH
jgi:histidinol-phosphatase (PHP family)